MNQYTLIEGEFTPEEAREMLMNLVCEKIRFHEVQILAKQERKEDGFARHEERIADLKTTRSKLKELIKLSEQSGQSLKLSAVLAIQTLSKEQPPLDQLNLEG